MRARVLDVYGSWRGPIRDALAALLAEAADLDAPRHGGAVPEGRAPRPAKRIGAAWRHLAALLSIRAFCEDLHVRALVRIAAPDIAARLDRRHADLDASIAAIDDAFAAIGRLAQGRERRTATRRLCTLLGAVVAEHLADRAVERSAMSALATQFDPLVLLTARRVLHASLEGELALAGFTLPEEATAQEPQADATLFAEAARILAAAARTRRPPAIRQMRGTAR